MLYQKKCKCDKERQFNTLRKNICLSIFLASQDALEVSQSVSQILLMWLWWVRIPKLKTDVAQENTDGHEDHDVHGDHDNLDDHDDHEDQEELDDHDNYDAHDDQ